MESFVFFLRIFVQEHFADRPIIDQIETINSFNLYSAFNALKSL